MAFVVNKEKASEEIERKECEVKFAQASARNSTIIVTLSVCIVVGKSVCWLLSPYYCPVVRN